MLHFKKNWHTHYIWFIKTHSFWFFLATPTTITHIKKQSRTQEHDVKNGCVTSWWYYSPDSTYSRRLLSDNVVAVNSAALTERWYCSCYVFITKPTSVLGKWKCTNLDWWNKTISRWLFRVYNNGILLKCKIQISRAFQKHVKYSQCLQALQTFKTSWAHALYVVVMEMPWKKSTNNFQTGIAFCSAFETFFTDVWDGERNNFSVVFSEIQ